ncbi:hypothetical protein HMPREF0541_00387 [Lacticaseibacillus rhamnosus ATCC 21052]|nr:hypothetical protein HMPREF0541_00387 [Lacticaseibacillus rhamnosus ATCC 21052]
MLSVFDLVLSHQKKWAQTISCLYPPNQMHHVGNMDLPARY